MMRTAGDGAAASSPLQLLVRTNGTAPVVLDTPDAEDDDPFGGIRCLLCSWRPSASSRWYCNCVGTPEPWFEGCGAVWNTFSTAGRCPGCGHQWQWTSCLRCGGASLHRDWYRETEA
jgi:hypothetical protein